MKFFKALKWWYMPAISLFFLLLVFTWDPKSEEKKRLSSGDRVKWILREKIPRGKYIGVFEIDGKKFVIAKVYDGVSIIEFNPDSLQKR